MPRPPTDGQVASDPVDRKAVREAMNKVLGEKLLTKPTLRQGVGLKKGDGVGGWHEGSGEAFQVLPFVQSDYWKRRQERLGEEAGPVGMEEWEE